MLKFISFASRNQSEELLPQGGAVNKYQKTAVGGAITMVFACLLVMMEGEPAIKVAAIFMVIVALLVFPVIWNTIYSLIGAMGVILSVAGHGIGTLGDTVIGWTTKRRGHLIIRQYKDSARISVRTEYSQETAELDVPEFMRQEDNTSIGVFGYEPEPAS